MGGAIFGRAGARSCPLLVVHFFGVGGRLLPAAFRPVSVLTLDTSIGRRYFPCEPGRRDFPAAGRILVGPQT
jgi:hypothetical protein